jgi:hypothetical protein
VHINKTTRHKNYKGVGEMRRLQFCLAVFALLALTSSAFAQVQYGQITGTVTDPSGAAIANAKVTVTNPATNLSISTTTNSSGNYTVKELPLGLYKVTAEASGFKTVSNTDITVNAGTIAHVDVKMTMGQAREIVEVTGAAAAVNTEDSKLASTVSSAQISNLPLNGRNVYDLMKMSTGAVDVLGIDFENGHSTVVNGLREDFNGFLVNGVSNKGLSGGNINTPIQDTVEEFQQLQLNMSAQYGNSAGTINNLVMKSGTNAFHGTVWEYLRNDAMDANQFFLNQGGTKKPALRFNQFGFTLGGPIVKDKLFFFGSYQGDRFKTVGTPQTIFQETQAWRDAVASGLPNSTANLLYGDFKPSVAGTPAINIDDYITQISPNLNGFSSYVDYLCPDTTNATIAARFQALLGVTAADNFSNVPFTGAPCSTTPALQAGSIGRDPVTGFSGLGFQETSTAIFKSQTGSLGNGNLFNGNEATLRLDYNWNTSNRFYAQFNWQRQTDSFGPCNASCTRGFSNPLKGSFPTGTLSFVHTFSPTILNEFRAGYAQNRTLIATNIPGVPQIAFTDASAGFGSYSGYPQFFTEHIYTYSDMVSISHGNHNMHIGVDFRRNKENSEFSVARPSYYFFDPIFFAADSPYAESAGVNPGICAPPCTSLNQSPVPQLESNVRHWRNWEIGAYFQDDWKISRRLTLNLGIRYDLFQRHSEQANLATTFIRGPGSNLLEQMRDANVPAGTIGTIGGTTYDCTSDSAIALSTIAGVCGPGGFAPAKSLGAGDHNNWGPRVGFAWDMFGDGKTSLRGGFGVAYEGTLYNPLSNSRWNLPYYSFNSATNFLIGDPQDVIYGPTTCAVLDANGNCTPSGEAPTFTGPPTNPGQGVGAQATGNLTGWAPRNPNAAILTGVVFPEGIKDPYVYNYFLSLQREILPKTVVQLDYVGTTGHKLFRAESINREPGTRLPAGACADDNFGRNWCGTFSTVDNNGNLINSGRLNNNYGNIRNWRNVVNSNYNSLQASLKRQMSHGVLFNASYTYSHAIDNGSTWHSGATTANGAAGGEGYSTDWTLPGLDRGNAMFDIRHRLVFNYIWQLPGQNLKGVAGAVVGGWSLNGVWAFQSGPHWEPYDSRARRFALVLDSDGNPVNPVACQAATFDPVNCYNAGGDYNLDRATNDRPSSSVPGFSDFKRATWAQGWFPTDANGNPLPPPQGNLPVLSSPCLVLCTGNLGRNTFVGPGLWSTDMTLAKVFKFTERVNMKFEAAAFNVFNRANFVLATAGGGAHNKVSDSSFGKAAGTLNARNLQVGVKISF